MFGTLKDEFGFGRFGHADWGKITVWESLPRMHRQMDEEIGSPYRKLFQTIEDELELERRSIGDLVDQRDPILVRSGGPTVFDIDLIAYNFGTGTCTVTLAVAHDFEAGNEVTFAGVATGSPLVVGSYVILEIASPTNTLLATQFTITQNLVPPWASATDGKVKLRDRRSTLVEVESYAAYTQAYYPDQADKPMVELTIAPGIDLEPLGIGYIAKLVVSSTLTPGAPSTSQVVTSQYSFKVLRITRRNDPETRDVLLCQGRVFDDTDPDLPDPIVLTFEQPSLLFELTQDFGIEPDDNLPTALQRSAAKNVVEFIQLKASKRGYEIRSEENGFNATVQGLYHLCADPGLPAAKIHHLVDPNDPLVTRMYTDVPPKLARYDQISADIEGVDYETGDPVFMTDEYIFDDDTRPFGESPLKSFFNRIFDVHVAGVSPVTQSVLDAYDLPYGQYVMGALNPVLRSMVGSIDGGDFSLTGLWPGVPVPPTGFSPENVFPIEVEDSYDEFSWLFVWIVGVPPSVTIPTGHYYLAYDPPVSMNCCWCKSHVIRLLLEPTAAFLASGTYTGAQVSAAIERLVERIVSEQLPVHARLGEVVLAQSVAVKWPDVSVTVSPASIVVTAGQLVFDNTHPGNPWFTVIGL